MNHSRLFHLSCASESKCAEREVSLLRARNVAIELIVLEFELLRE